MIRDLTLLFVTSALSMPALGQLGEQPAITEHVDQEVIEQGNLSVDELFDLGELLFDARFNRLDGQGRPASTGAGVHRDPDEPPFVRTSGPDANSCFGCHAQPRSGGAGDFVVNVFVLAQTLDPITTSIEAQFSNERNTLGMMGAGPIEMLAREVTAELIAIREAAKAEAQESGLPVTRTLVAKGVEFGSITVLPDGKIDPTGIEGVDWDLIIKPFHQKGAVVSLREFTNNAMNHHHGMQSVERFGAETDADEDGVVSELTVGDITATTIYQAALNAPGRVIPAEYEAEVAEGQQLFAQIGCATCHVPFMTLLDRNFTEPNPYNPPGNLGIADVTQVFSFDMTREGQKPNIEPVGGSEAIVRAFSDLKRHNLNDDVMFFFDNEQVPQGKLNGFAPETDFTIPAPPRPTDQFLTRKLWDVGNTGPYGHRGDLTTLTDAIFCHGGEGRETSKAFFELPQSEQDKIIEFLKSMQVVEEDAELVTVVGGDSTGGNEHGRMCGAIGGTPLLATMMLMATLRFAPARRRADRFQHLIG